MEETEKIKIVLTENNVTEVRKIESNCFEQINRLIEKMEKIEKWKGELKNIKRDHFVGGFLSEVIKNDQMIVAGR